jgi:hypothetical protein
MITYLDIDTEKEYIIDLRAPNNEAFTNFYIYPARAIEWAELEIGGQIIERVELFRWTGDKEVTFYCMSGGRSTPSLRYHDTRIRFRALVMAHIEIRYDTVPSYRSPDELYEVIIECERRIPVKCNIPASIKPIEIMVFVPPHIDSEKIGKTCTTTSINIECEDAIVFIRYKIPLRYLYEMAGVPILQSPFATVR